MTLPRSNRPDLSWQQLAAAAADGEVDDQTAQPLRNWLDRHPELASDMASQDEFSPRNTVFWRSMSIPAPNEKAWDAVFNEVKRRTAPAPIEPAKPQDPAGRGWTGRHRVLAGAGILGSLSAAVLVIAMFLGPQATTRGPDLTEAVEEVIPIAGLADVEILSIRDADARQLVVGEAPETATLALAAAGDVRLDALLPAGDGIVPHAEMGGQNAPMIYPPVARNP